MKLKDAISRVRFTISKSNKPNNTDVEAFNMILEHFQSTQEKTIKDNLISKPPIWAPQLEMKSSFEIMTLLRKYIEQFCNLTITLKEPTNEQSDKPDNKPF